MTTEQMTQHLQVSPRTLATWRDEGMPHIAVTARSYRYDLDKVQEWLEQRTDEVAADKAFDPKSLVPSVIAFYSALMDGAPPESWDLAAVRRCLARPLSEMSQRHRDAIEDFFVVRVVETGGSEERARQCLATAEGITAEHEEESVEELITLYKAEKYR